MCLLNVTGAFEVSAAKAAIFISKTATAIRIGNSPKKLRRKNLLQDRCECNNIVTSVTFVKRWLLSLP
jgi:hypothetical protein